MKVTWVIGIILFVVSLVGAISYFSNKESIVFSLLSQDQGEVVLTSLEYSNGSFAPTYTSNSEQNCVRISPTRKKCSTKTYPFRTFVNNKGNTLTDVGNFYYENGYFVVKFNDTTSYIKPYFTLTGQRTYLGEVPFQFTTPTTTERFNWKFGIGASGIVTTIDSIGFEVVNKSNDINFLFTDLEDNNFVVDDSNPNDIVVTNISNNVINGELFLDPVVELDSTDVQIDFDGAKTTGRFTDAGIQMRWDITDVPKGATIINATGEFFLPCSGICPANTQDTINLTWIQNRTWALGDWGNLHRDNTSLEEWFDRGSEGIGNHRWWLINLTTQFNVSYDFGYNNFSFRLVEDDARVDNADTFVDDANLDVWDGGSNTIFASSSNGNVSARPILRVYYEAEAIPPTVTLVNPLNNSNITAEHLLKSNFTCQVDDISTIDSVQLYSDFRNGTWQIEQTNGTDSTPKLNYSWTYFFSNWTNGGVKFADPPHNLSTTTDRALTGNKTVFLTTSQSDDTTRVFNQQGVNTSIWSNPDTTIVDIDMNDTNVVYVDILTKKIWLTNLDGTSASSCTASGTGNPYGIAFDDDNKTVWTVWQGSTENIYHNYVDNCSVITTYKITSGSPTHTTIHNGNAYILDAQGDPNTIKKIDLSTGENTTFVSAIDNIMDLGVDTQVGIWINYSDEPQPERLYIGATSPNSIGSIYRALNSVGNTYNCYACDIFTNCAFADKNFTFHVRNVTGTCWTYEEPKLFLPPGCVRQLVPGQVVIL